MAVSDPLHVGAPQHNRPFRSFLISLQPEDVALLLHSVSYVRWCKAGNRPFVDRLVGTERGVARGSALVCEGTRRRVQCAGCLSERNASENPLAHAAKRVERVLSLHPSGSEVAQYRGPIASAFRLLRIGASLETSHPLGSLFAVFSSWWLVA